MTAWSILSLLGGLVVLVVGADVLVRGASRLAAMVGVSPLVVGLTVVAFGTSAPELAVSVGGALSGAGGLAVGNAVGSNVFNVLAILGAAALASPLVVHQRLVRIDVPLVVAVTAVTWLLAADGRLARLEGVALMAGLAAYTVWSYRASRREPPEVAAEYAEAFATPTGPVRRRWPLAVVAVAGGLGALVVGARLLVAGATTVAGALGVPDLVVGSTIVAAGTSLPELATSVAAARRGERDIAVGNVVGSNLFNLLGVLGLAAVVAPAGLAVSPAALETDLPVALLAMVVAAPVLATGLVLMRWEGALLLVGYGGYLATLVLASTDSAAAPAARVGLGAGLGVLAVVLAAVAVSQRRQAGR